MPFDAKLRRYFRQLWALVHRQILKLVDHHKSGRFNQTKTETTWSGFHTWSYFVSFFFAKGKSEQEEYFCAWSVKKKKKDQVEKRCETTGFEPGKSRHGLLHTAFRCIQLCPRHRVLCLVIWTWAVHHFLYQITMMVLCPVLEKTEHKAKNSIDGIQRATCAFSRRLNGQLFQLTPHHRQGQLDVCLSPWK